MSCCKHKLGEFNRRIVIEERVTVTTPLGGEEVTWVEIANPWAKMKPITGREKVHADRLDAVGMTQIIIRYRPDLDESMRVVYRGDELNIRSIINIDEADEFIEILAERGVSR